MKSWREKSEQSLTSRGLFVGWMMILVGAWLAKNTVHLIMTRRVIFGFTGREDFTVEDNVLRLGPCVLLAILEIIAGIGVLRRWHWVHPWGLFIGLISTLALLLLWVSQN